MKKKCTRQKFCSTGIHEIINVYMDAVVKSTIHGFVNSLNEKFLKAYLVET